MTGPSRRSFLRGAGVTAVVATATAITPGAAMAATSQGSKSDESVQGDAATGTVIAYVKDSKTGEINVMSGDREVVVKDRKLAQKLARLAD